MTRHPILTAIGTILAIAAATIAVICAIYITVIGAIAGQQILTDPEHVKPDRPGRPVAAQTAPLPLSAVGGDHPQPIIDQQAAWYAGIRDAEDTHARAQEAERLAATLRTPIVAVARPGTSRTECEGHVIPGYIIARESGCNYDAVSPPGFCSGTGCYGLYQIAGFHWNGGGCSDLTWTIPAEQDECARRLSSGGTNLAPWGG